MRLTGDGRDFVKPRGVHPPHPTGPMQGFPPANGHWPADGPTTMACHKVH